MSKLILFQGDSITDCGRDRTKEANLGNGYARLVAGTLGYDCPEQYRFLNRGISGNRIVDLYARIKIDIINLKPDYMSILIGVNDVWHEVARQNGVAPEKFEKIYTMLLDEIFEQLPDLKVMILTPYCVEGPATCNTEEAPDRWDVFSGEVAKNAEIAKKIAKKFNLPYIDLQAAFDKASENVPAAYFTADGVHPTEVGHELIKRNWLECFEKIK